MPFLLRCWLISSIGESPTLVRSRWAKEEVPPARDVQAGLLYWVLFEGLLSFSRTFYLLCRQTHAVFSCLFILNIWVEEHSSDGDTSFYSVKLGFAPGNSLAVIG